MIANIITLIRLPLTFSVIALFGRYAFLDVMLLVTIAVIFSLDAVDGLVARKRNETSEMGALLDTLADRIIENTFWIYFTTIGLLPLWMPIAVMTRGFLTDTLQQLHSTPTHGWEYTLTRSRISRGLYGSLKMIAFMSLASVMVFKTPFLEKMSLLLALAAIVFCLLRAVPIIPHLKVRVSMPKI